MTFSSLIFLFGFLPIGIVLYHLIPINKVKNIVLLILSFLFYAWDSPIYLVLLILSIFWIYFASFNIEKSQNEKMKKRIFCFSVGVELFILGFFKYVNFLIDILNTVFSIQHLNLSLPVGLSFFTFSAISYLADVYMNKTTSQKSILNLSLYIAYFGKVSMGPIVQYHQMEEQLALRKVSRLDIQEGIYLFLKGLFKKVLFADRMALLFSALQSNTTVLGTWLYALSYMLQLYFDFSGYSDMAIGLSRLFGFHFEANFDHPYSAISVQDFWRRWHISLSRWFRDYVYIPLGGNRVSNKKYIRNIFVVWFLTGLWHGANWTFIIWGLYYGCLLLIERFVLKDRLSKLPKFIQHLYALFLVYIGWIFFMSSDILTALSTIGRLFGVGASGLVNSWVFFYLKNYFWLLVFGIFLSGNNYRFVQRANYILFKKKSAYVSTFVYIFLLIVSISFIVSSTFQSFLYFAF